MFSQHVLTSTSGIENLRNFYSLSLIYDKENLIDRELAEVLLPIVRKRILRDCAISMIGESRYCMGIYHYTAKVEAIYKVCERFKIENVDEIIGRLTQLSNDAGLDNKTNLYESLKQEESVSKYINVIRTLFYNKSMWPGSSYGGKKWAKIAGKWIQLERFHDFNDHNEHMVLIDQLIDAAHNNGHCLDKIYGTVVNQFLDIKSLTRDPFYVVNGSSISRYACKRMKSRYGLHQDGGKQVLAT